MRRPDQLFNNEEIKNKVLEGIHFGFCKSDTLIYSDPERKRKEEVRGNIFEELLLLMKIYKHCADNVTNLSFVAYDCDDYYDVSFYERFDTYGQSRYTTIRLPK